MKDARAEAERSPTADLGSFLAGALWMHTHFSKMGGKKGGKARAASLSPERRSEIARTAVAAREAKRAKNQ
jgi:hypothetical protein